MIVPALIIIYVLIIYAGIPFFVPYWRHGRVPNVIPDDWQKEIDTLNKDSSSDEEYVKKAYDYITTRYYAGRFKTIINSRFAFEDPFSHPSGYLPCHLQNYLLRVMLIKSGRFTEKDIKSETAFLNFFIHQYLKVHVNGEWIFVDPAGKDIGSVFGDRSIGFR